MANTASKVELVALGIVVSDRLSVRRPGAIVAGEGALDCRALHRALCEHRSALWRTWPSLGAGRHHFSVSGGVPCEAVADEGVEVRARKVLRPQRRRRAGAAEEEEAGGHPCH